MAKTVYATGDIPTAANFNAFTQEANAAITGGTVNGAAIGGTTPAAGSFTTLGASGAVTAANNIGYTVKNTLGTAITTHLMNASNVVQVGDIYSYGYAAEFLAYSTATTKINGTAIAAVSSTGLAVTGAITASTTIKFGGYTVATLPAAGTVGRLAYVTDAITPTYAATLTGSGAVKVPVFDNGTAWISA